MKVYEIPYYWKVLLIWIGIIVMIVSVKVDACTIPYENIDVVNSSSPVYFCGGTYTLVDADDNGAIWINADGVHIICNGTIIKGGGQVSSRGLSTARQNVIVEGCTFESYDFNVRLSTRQNVTLKGNSFNDARTYAIYNINNDANNYYNNTFSNSTTAGVYLYGVKSALIHNNTFEDQGLGIWLNVKSNNTAIYDNTFRNSVYSSNSAILFQDNANNITVERNIISTNDRGIDGIKITDGVDMTFRNNNINNSDYAIKVTDSTAPVMIYNNTITKSEYGITLEKTDKVNISGNFVYDADHGYLINNQSDGCDIHNNYLSNASYGILLEHGSRHNRVYSNDVTADIGIYELHDTDNNTVHSNYINGELSDLSNGIKLLDNVSNANYYNNELINCYIDEFFQNFTIKSKMDNELKDNAYIFFDENPNNVTFNDTSLNEIKIALDNGGIVYMMHGGEKYFQVMNNTVMWDQMGANQSITVNATQTWYVDSADCIYPVQDIKTGNYDLVCGFNSFECDGAVNATAGGCICENGWEELDSGMCSFLSEGGGGVNQINQDQGDSVNTPDTDDKKDQVPNWLPALLIIGVIYFIGKGER